ncbi:MAG: serine--tRNA ligase, partial [bacterium]|nr:serine--tRNA ligase [bacterium]
MLDIKFIRENTDIVKAALAKRHYAFDLERLLQLDELRRAVIQETERLRAEQNIASKNFSETERENLKVLKENLQKKEEELKKTEEEFDRMMLLVPNIPDPTVPEGKSEEDNIEMRTWGEPRAFNFKI